jgi:hypothetical protein
VDSFEAILAEGSPSAGVWTGKKKQKKNKKKKKKKLLYLKLKKCPCPLHFLGYSGDASVEARAAD